RHSWHVPVTMSQTDLGNVEQSGFDLQLITGSVPPVPPAPVVEAAVLPPPVPVAAAPGGSRCVDDEHAARAKPITPAALKYPRRRVEGITRRSFVRMLSAPTDTRELG